LVNVARQLRRGTNNEDIFQSLPIAANISSPCPISPDKCRICPSCGVVECI